MINKTTVTLFVIYGPANVSHINNLLIPALANQIGAERIELYLLNYLSNEALFTTKQYLKVRVVDLSASRENKRLGFGEAVNYLFFNINPKDYFITLNPDTIPDPKLLAALTSSYIPGVTGIIEARQWPHEHPKEYNSLTLDTPWASCACALIESENFYHLKGFDPVYFLYCEDVDLSWRTWLKGKRVIYQPEASIIHLTGLLKYRPDRLYYEDFYSLRNFIVIAKKFFAEQGAKKAKSLLYSSLYEQSFIEAIIASYKTIEATIAHIEHDAHKMIKITGLNRYHSLRVINNVRDCSI